MPSQKKTSRRKRHITKRSSQLKATSVMDLVTNISHSQSSTAAVTSSSSLLKRYEDVRRYFDITPPNLRLTYPKKANPLLSRSVGWATSVYYLMGK
jgi:hypothetical protein